MNEKIFVISDTHFGHKNIIKLCGRPFDTVEEMDQTIIKNWNDTVKLTDTIFCLGDFSWHSKNRTNEIFEQLNGNKHLIVGNHDPSRVTGLPWKSVSYIKELNYNKNLIVMCHYPIRSWNHMYHGSMHVYGHEHGNMAGIGRSMDVGVDTNGFVPYNIKTVVDKLSMVPF